MGWCLIKKYADDFRKALKDGTISPEKLATMKDSATRREFLSKFVGEENAMQINALYESKLLLSNTKIGMITWAKKILGNKSKVARDIISRIDRMDRILNPKEGESFKQDLVSTRLGIGVSQEEAKQISDMAEKNRELKAKIPENSPIRSRERLEYGTANALLKEHMAEIKADANRISFREQPARWTLDKALNAIPNLSQAIMTAYDNSVWLRQLNSALFTPRYSGVWTRNFLKSWKDIGRELKGHDAMLAIKADVYSRPNAINGKYDADPTGYGLGVKSEEVYQSDIPAKIPALGRLFKASRTAFNGGALRTRADIADIEIKVAETLGKNVLDKKTAAALGSMVTSITGRGSIGGSENLLRKVFWAPRMYAGQLNQLTFHMFDSKATAYTRMRAAKNLTSMLGTYTLVFALAKFLDPDSVDPKDHLGKIKIWGKWVDTTGGKASWLTLVMKMTDKVIAGLGGKKFGFKESTAWDDLNNFAEGKMSPTASVIRDVLKGELYGGKPITLGGVIKGRFTPISAQTYEQLSNDPNVSGIFGLMLLEELGANVSSWMEPNKKTKVIPTGVILKKDNFMSMVEVYAKALGEDPETALNRIFTGQKIMQVSGGGIVVVERQTVEESQAFKKKWVREHGGRIADIKEVKLDHTIPIKLGGEEKESNWKIVSTSEWSSYTPVETKLIQAVKDKKIGLKEAQQLIVDFKNGKITKDQVFAKLK